ncbi:MAG: type I secretion system permease/ATPase [Gammaproteobacteria bacterium]|jgi:PrtD family type I secretion system ABC transporter|nr:type I secretion system permease/ATPase [Gammaproteobacteria bacterium]
MAGRGSSPIAAVLQTFRGAFAAVVLFSVFVNLLQLTLPLYMMNLFTYVFTSLSSETLVMLTVVAVGALALQSTLEALRGRVLARVGASLDARLGRDVLAALVRSSAGTASRSAQAMRDVHEVRAALAGPEVYKLVDIPLTPFFLLVLYLLHPVLGLLALFGALILLGLALLNELITRPPLEAANSEGLKSLGRVEDYVRNADAIEAMGMMPAVIKRWEHGNSRKLAQMTRAGDRGNLLGTIARFTRIMLQVGIMAAGAYLYLQHELMTGAMIAAALLMSRAVAPFESAIVTWKTVVGARAAYRRLSDLMRVAAERSVGMSLPAPRGQVSVEKISAVAPGTSRVTLKGVSFELAPGEMLGVIGPSGAGKSTLGKVLVGVARPAGGVARLDGADVYQWNADELGRFIGYLPQDVQLFGGTVAENIARLDPQPPAEAVVAAARRAGVHDLILRLPKGYETPVGEGGQALSAGQRQHIALARALYGTPRLVVLDEPNSNLDASSEEALVQAMAQARGAGVTLVVITHRPSLLEGADRLLVLRDGAVDTFGPREEVMARFRRGATAPRPSLPQPPYPQYLTASGGGSVTPLRPG